MRVLSLYNGISSGRLALKRAGIEVEKYVSFEVDKYANAIAKYQFSKGKQQKYVKIIIRREK